MRIFSSLKDKGLTTLVLLFWFTAPMFSQTYNMASNNGQTVATTTGTIYDSGGPTGNYSDNQSQTLTINVGTGNSARLTFSSYTMESGYDFIYIYFGSSATGTIAQTLTNTGTNVIVTSTNQYITLKFVSDYSETRAGFAATISAVSSCANVTAAGTISSDQTNCGTFNPDLIANASSPSGGSGTLEYQWESNTNGIWVTIAGATAATYEPSSINVSTQYRRGTKRAGCSTWLYSNVVVKTVAGSNILLNSEFDSGLTSWTNYIETSGGAAATIAADNSTQLAGTNSARINVTAVSTSNWHVQLIQSGINIVAGKRYALTFRAKANASKPIVVALDSGSPSYTTAFSQDLNISSSNSLYSYIFTATQSMTNARVVFNLGSATGTYYVDQVSINETCSQPELCGDNTDANGNGIADCTDPACTQILYNGEFDLSQAAWNFYPNGTNSTGSLAINNSSLLSGANSLQATINTTTGTDWHAQLAQSNIGILAGKKYKVSFRAYASSNRNISVMQQMNVSPWTYSFYKVFNVTTTPTLFTTEIIGETDIPSGSFIFNLGAATGTIYIDDVKLEYICSTTAEVCNNGSDDDGDGLIDAADSDCITSCSSPELNFANPTLLSGTGGANGAEYRFSNVIPGVDGRLTIVSRSHSDIAIISLDEPATSYGGYNAAFQPIIDYNYFNNPGFDPSGDKSVTFNLRFVKSGTNIDTTLSLVSMTGVDVDGSGEVNEIKEWLSSSGYTNYATQSNTLLSTSGTLKAQGPYNNFPNISENSTEVMVTYNYVGASQINFTYGAFYGGSTTLYDDVMPNSDEKRLNSLYFKCYNLNQEVCGSVSPPVPGGPFTRCGAGSLTLTATGCTGGQIQWFSTSSGGTALAAGNTFTTPSLSGSTTYYIECLADGCTSSPRVAVNATIQNCGEICNNGIDDDGDGLVDASDTDCNSCAFVGQNLIVNGEFDAGNSGFTSDYTYTAISNMCGNYGIYGIGSRIGQVGTPVGCNNSIWSVADRANAGGNFMLIDPSGATGVNDKIWAQNITVCPNTDYVFSVWTKNMYYQEATGYSNVDPNFQFKINGVILPGADFIMPRQMRADSTSWIKVQGTWNSGSSTSATLNIVNKVSGSLGNDLAIDGLFFGLCGKINAITTNTTTLCPGGSATISATIQASTSGWSFYEWLKDGVVVASGTSATSYSANAAGTYKSRTYTTPNSTGCPNESNSIVITANTSVNVISQINNGSDDAEEFVSTSVVTLNSTDLEVGMDGSAAQIIGMRFPSINVPKDAIITNAYIEFETDVAWSNSTSSVIHGQNVDNAVTFSASNANISYRAKTASSIAWSPGAWNTVDQKQNSPDVKNIIQEIVNRSGWVSGNALALIITGSTGTREAESFEGEAAAAPRLYITYTICNNTEICNNGIDDDGDGLSDCNDGDCYLAGNSGEPDTDDDGIGNICDMDDDNDGIVDTNECSICDTDGDDIIDKEDTDSDNDGCGDAIEGAGNFGSADIDGNLMLTGGVNSAGVPSVAGANGQGTTSAVTDGNVQNCNNSNCSSGITISNTTISTCIDQPLQDVVNVSTTIAWSSILGTRIEVILNNKTEIIDVAGGVTSPQILTFRLPANNTNYTLEAKWTGVGSPNPVTIMENFQIMTENNLTINGGSHIHGPLGVGGNLILNSSPEINMDNVGTYIFPGDGSISTGLLVKGGMTLNSGTSRVLSGKLIHIGNSSGLASGDNGNNSMTRVYPASTNYNNGIRLEGTIDQTPSPLIFQAVPMDFVSKFNSMKASSAAMAAKVNNTTLYNSSTNNPIPSNSISSSTGVKILTLPNAVNYLNITAASLGKITEFKFDGPDFPSASKLLVINVTVSGDFVWNNPNFPGLSGSLHGRYIIWNFYSTTNYNLTINTSSLLIGTVYAPNINVTKNGSGDIDGNIIARSMTIGVGEIHYYPFNGSVVEANGSICPATAAISTPAPCSNDVLSCNVLYLCGLDKPFDGDAWDHGIIEYLDANNGSSSITPVLTKNEAGMGTYDAMNPNTFMNLDFNNYQVIVISATTEGHVSPSLINALKNYVGGIILSNYLLQDDLGFTSVANQDVVWSSSAYTSNTLSEGILNYGNPTSWSGKLLTHGDYLTSADAYLWAGSGDANNKLNGIFYRYESTDVLPGITSHGPRVYLGYHMNGIYANNSNNGVLPSPASSWFNPVTHLTAKGKELFDRALIMAGTNCVAEVCNDNKDNDQDGLTDCSDPECTETLTITSTSPGNRCGTGTVLLGAAASAGTINWYSAATGGTNLGTGSSFTTPSISSTTTYYVEVSSGLCTSLNRTSVIATINPNNTATSNATRTLCINTALSPSITHSTTGATGIGFSTGLPAGVTATWVSNTITISGTPTASGTFNYSIPLTGGCGSVSATGTIIVAPNNTATSNATRTLCNNTALSPSITHTTTGATGIGSSVGLPAGVTASWASNTITISGTPTASGTFNYSIPLTGGCGAISATGTIVVNATPGTPIVGTITHPTCISAGSVVLSGLPSSGTWTLTQSPSGTTYTGTGTSYTVTGLAAGTTNTFTVTNASTCTSLSSANVVVNTAPGAPSVSLNYNGSACLTTGLQITAVPAGGSSPFSFAWSGPYGFTATTQVASIDTNGTYNVTITDANGCTAQNSGIVYQRYETFIATVGSTVCQGDPVALSANGTNVASYKWSVNAGESTAKDVTVYPSPPSTTYQVTITNTQGCSAVPTLTVNVTPKPSLSLTGPDSICVGQTSQFSASAAGSWIALNSSIASINSAGQVIGLSSGLARFIFVQTATGCKSDTSSYIFVKANPTVTLTGPSEICIGSTTSFTPSNGGNWSSSNSSIASITNSGIVTGVAQGVAYFTFASNSTGCSNTSNTGINVVSKSPAYLSGPDTICTGLTGQYISTKSTGVWSVSNTSIATINSSGLVTGISEGPFWIYFNHSATGCPQIDSTFRRVVTSPSVTYTSVNSSCDKNDGAITIAFANHPTFTNIRLSINGGTAFITVPDNSGTYTFNNLSAGTYNIVTSWSSGLCSKSNGTVTLIDDQGPPKMTVMHTNEPCGSNSGGTITLGITDDPIQDKFRLSLDGGNSYPYLIDDNIGTYTISGVSPGTKYIAAKWNNNKCEVFIDTISVLSGSSLSGTISKSDTICIGASSTLLASGGTNYLWSNNATTASITVTPSTTTTYSVTISDSNGCSAVKTASIFVINNIGVTLDYKSGVCLNSLSQLEAIPTGGLAPFTYSWTGPNGFTNNSKLINITNHGAYAVTITDAKGCSGSGTGFVYQEFVPIVNSSDNNLCVGESTTISVSAPSAISYKWSNNAGSSTSSNVTVTPPVGNQLYQVTVTNNLGCQVAASVTVIVNARPAISVSGSNTICVGGNTQLMPNSGGIWTTVTPTIASITNGGVVTGIKGGQAKFYYVETTNYCQSADTLNVTVAPDTITGTNRNDICVGDTIYLTPSTGGTWSAIDTNVFKVTSWGRVIAKAQGQSYFTFLDNGTGCIRTTPSLLQVIDKPSTNLQSPNLCVGFTTNIIPNSNGTWTSSNSAVATINNNGLITGVGVGQASFVYVSSTGCTSDPSAILTVTEKQTVEITGPTSVCIGDTSQLTPSSGGTWTSSNSNIASISNSGKVTGLAPGQSTFVFTSAAGTCVSNASAPITVNPKPIVILTGSSNICVGSTTTLTSSGAGTWTSNNSGIATISAAGVVTGVSAGSTTFRFSLNSSNCISDASTPILIQDKPITQLIGPDSICIGSFTNFTPSSGGIWVSSNSNIASITATGEVLGKTAGQVKFVFLSGLSGCNSDSTIAITIVSKPTITLAGPTNICISQSTQFNSSLSGGYWLSSNSAVATISSNGVVTGVSQGLARFTYVSAFGCSSEQSSAIIINGKPNVIISNSGVCEGATINVLPSSGGTWASSDTSIAQINNFGLVAGKKSGIAYLTFTDASTGCASDGSALITVYGLPPINVPTLNLCVGSTASIAPTTGGIWTSINTSVASVTNNGLVNALSAGSTRFYFTSTVTGCRSKESNEIIVAQKPIISFTGPTNICVGYTTTIDPISGGTWTSSNSNVATIANDGTITGRNSGFVTFTFRSMANCISEPSSPLTVNAKPSVGYSGPSNICAGQTTNVFPSSGGTWKSLDTLVVTITNSGVVTGKNQGSAILVYTDLVTNCTSDSTLVVHVLPSFDIDLTGDSIICSEFTTKAVSQYGGLWVSSNPRIASVASSGIVTGHIPGKVEITLLANESGCESANGVTVEVEKCLNHDFDVTLPNVPVSGNIGTNDGHQGGFIYNNSVISISKPSGSISSLTVQTDGSYTFLSNTDGKYIYEVPICAADLSGCSKSNIEFTVVGDLFAGYTVSNLDLMTTRANANTANAGNMMSNNLFANDKCIKFEGCNLNTSTFSMVNPVDYGVGVVNGVNQFSYTPNAGFIGKDTLLYNVCNDAGHCSVTKLFVLVTDQSSSNMVTAADDFNYTYSDATATGNVLTNDSDPEGNTLAVTPTGSLASPMPITGGSYYIKNNGDFAFIPLSGFSGPTSFVYEVCDNNVDQKCVKATAHIIVLGDLKLNLKVYLEGALVNNGNALSATGKPLMRDDLRVSPYTGKNYIPRTDPYTTGIGDFSLGIKAHVGPGLLAQNKTIIDSAAVFGVAGDNAIVDWVFVDIRSKSNPALSIATRSGLLQRDGDIVDIDGVSALLFNGVTADSFYVVVKHRNHLGVMSKIVSYNQTIDFTNPSTSVFNYGTSLPSGYDYKGLSQKPMKNSYVAMWGGDFNSDGKVIFTGPNDDINTLFFEVLFHPENIEYKANFDLGHGYKMGDFDLDSKAKYINPNDDTNMLYAQLLFYALNLEYATNFEGFFEQVAK